MPLEELAAGSWQWAISNRHPSKTDIPRCVGIVRWGKWNPPELYQVALRRDQPHLPTTVSTLSSRIMLTHGWNDMSLKDEHCLLLPAHSLNPYHNYSLHRPGVDRVSRSCNQKIFLLHTPGNHIVKRTSCIHHLC